MAPCDFVQWLKHDMRGAIPIRRLQSLVDEPLGGERETFAAHRRPRDGAAQPFEFVALICCCDHTGMHEKPVARAAQRSSSPELARVCKVNALRPACGPGLFFH